MAKQPKPYSDKLRRSVVRKVLDEQQETPAVSLACGVPTRLIDDWVEEEILKRGETEYEGHSMEEVQAEYERLMRERAYLQARRDIVGGVASDKGGALGIAGLDPVDYEDDW